MALRYRSENEAAHVRARKNNLWIRHKGHWYTPGEFKQYFGSGYSHKTGNVELLNPIPFLKAGREMIDKMVMEGKPAATISNALKRLYAFEDKLRLTGFREKEEGQAAGARWPDN